jgi:hypothetical protein
MPPFAYNTLKGPRTSSGKVKRREGAMTACVQQLGFGCCQTRLSHSLRSRWLCVCSAADGVKFKDVKVTLLSLLLALLCCSTPLAARARMAGTLPSCLSLHLQSQPAAALASFSALLTCSARPLHAKDRGGPRLGEPLPPDGGHPRNASTCPLLIQEHNSQCFSP